MSEHLLRSLGLNEKNLFQVSSPEFAAQMLNVNRIDMWAYGEDEEFKIFVYK